MERIGGGYWFVLGAALVFGLGMMDSFKRARKVSSRIQGLQVWCIQYAAALAATVLTGSLLCGLALVAWNAYTYLRFGIWSPYRIGDILYILDLSPVHSTGWVGVDRMLLDFAGCSGLWLLLLILPGLCFFAMVWMISVNEKMYVDRNPRR